MTAIDNLIVTIPLQREPTMIPITVLTKVITCNICLKPFLVLKIKISCTLYGFLRQRVVDSRMLAFMVITWSKHVVNLATLFTEIFISRI